MLSTRELAAVLVRMKARLAYRQQSRSATALNVIGALLGVAGTIGASFWLISNRSAPDASTQMMLAVAGISLAWLVLSIVIGSGEIVLDPGNFAIFPVSNQKLTAAFLMAAFVGVLAPSTAIVALSTVSYAPTIFAAIVIIVGAIVVTFVCVLSGRLGLAIMSSLVRGRRTREIAAAVTVLLAVSAGLIPQFAFQLADQVTAEQRATGRAILRWFPWGWGPEGIASAAEGRIGRAIALIGFAAIFAILLSDMWRRIMNQILTTRPAASSTVSVEGGLIPRILQPFGRSPTVAATARALRQLRRDPREFLEIAGFLPLVLVSALPALDALRDGEQAVVLSTVSVGAGLGMTTLNMFGADGRSFGVDALALGNLAPVLMGKAVSRVLLGVPLVLLGSLVLAAITGGWAFVLPGVMISMTALLAMAAVGMQVSVRYPFPLPERAGAAGGGSGAAGCAVGVIRAVAIIVALAVAAVGTVPVGLISIFVSPWLGAVAGVISLGYGVAIFWFAGRSAGERATEQTPELYQTLSTPLA